MKTVGVLGATGVYGRHLLPRLAAAGYRVRVLARDLAKASVAQACGAEVVSADLFDEASLRSGLAGCEIALNLATSLPSPARAGGDFALTDRMRREGIHLWLRACAGAGVQRVLQQSIAMIHGGGGDAWADESTFHALDGSTLAGSAIAAVRDMEAAVGASGLDWVLLRGGLFYGPGTGFDDDWFSRAHAGKLRLPEQGLDFVSLLHVSDMATATIAALSRWPSRRALIVADDAPVRWRDLFTHVSVLAGSALPAPGGRPSFPSFRVRNTLARETLGWAPAYPDYRAGLAR